MKKKWFLCGAGVILLVTVIAVICVMLHKENKDGTTRYEWIEMLTEQFGMNEPGSENPYFNDVDVDSPYFDCVQSAYEWELLEEGSSFHGEKTADGEFVALTAMRAIGRYKVQIYLGLSDEPSDKDYLDLAVEKGLIRKEQLDKGISKEESIAVLERASNLKLSQLWKDDVCDLQYRDDVIEIAEADTIAVKK